MSSDHILSLGDLHDAAIAAGLSYIDGLWQIVAEQLCVLDDRTLEWGSGDLAAFLSGFMDAGNVQQ